MDFRELIRYIEDNKEEHFREVIAENERLISERQKSLAESEKERD